MALKDVKLPTDLPRILTFYEDSPFVRKQVYHLLYCITISDVSVSSL
jgi:hypothetical protein